MAKSDFKAQLAKQIKEQDMALALARYRTFVPDGKWNPIRYPIDYYLLNGIESPGLASFPSLEVSEKWEQITGPGLTGAVPVFRGTELAQFEVVHRLYDEGDWKQFHVFLPLLQRARRGRRPQALRILHPLLDLFDPPIRAVVRPKWTLPSEPDDNGVCTFKVTYWEYFKPKAEQARPEAAKPEPDLDYWEKMIKDLTAQNEALAREIDRRP